MTELRPNTESISAPPSHLAAGGPRLRRAARRRSRPRAARRAADTTARGLYMRNDVAKAHLLTPQAEVALAKRLDRARRRLEKTLSRTPAAAAVLSDLAAELAAGSTTIIQVLRPIVVDGRVDSYAGRPEIFARIERAQALAEDLESSVAKGDHRVRTARLAVELSRAVRALDLTTSVWRRIERRLGATAAPAAARRRNRRREDGARALNAYLSACARRARTWRAAVDAATEEMTTANLRLVVRLACGFCGQGVDFEDLVQQGNLGLLRAIEKFEWRKGFKFSTYATWWIRQFLQRAVLDGCDTVRVPVHARHLLRRVRQAAAALVEDQGGVAELSAIAEKIGDTEHRVAFALARVRKTISLETPLSEDEALTLGDSIEDPAPGPLEIACSSELATILRQAVASLPDQQRRVIELRYWPDELSLQEVGVQLGLSRERIRQIEARALDALRDAGRFKRLHAARAGA